MARSEAVVILFVMMTGGVLSSTMTTQNAMDYLKQYHYMGEENPDPRIAALSDEDGFEMGILSFQRMHGLNETGILDDPTIELMSMPRCGLPDVMTIEDTYVNMEQGEGARRRKRYTLEGSRWMKSFLTYKITVYTPDLQQSAVDREIRRAFQVWEMVTDLRFAQVAVNQDSDIVILFGAGSHGDPFPFDGASGTLAHAFFPRYGGDAHFDESETWTINTFNGINLFQVAAHEFGHALGLSHSNINAALMAPFYRGYQPNFMLHSDDVLGIQAIYGRPTTTRSPLTTTTTTPRTEGMTPRGAITTPRPAVTTKVATTTTESTSNTDLVDLCESGKMDAITQVQHADGNVKLYAFRKDYYAEIGNGQVMPGFPKKISEGWPGLPNDIDAAIFWEATYSSFIDWSDSDSPTMVDELQSEARTYFFKGNQYWRFIGGVMDQNYPKNIGQQWGLPSDLDAAFVWSGNGRSYFFKGNTYYRYTRGRNRRDRGYPRSVNVWSNAFVGGVDGAIGVQDNTYFMRNGDYYLYNDASVEIADGYPQDSRIGILGCNRLQIVGSNDEENDLINGAPSLTHLQSTLTSCLILLLTALVM